MKNLIDSLGITHRRFAEEFKIPYRTVASWYTGERTPPQWAYSLIEQIIKYKGNGTQISLFEKTYYLHYVNYNLSYVYEDIETAKKWQNFSKNVTKAAITEIKEIKVFEENTIMIAKNYQKKVN